MALETGTFISDLVVTNPVASDPLAAADDHLRLIKTTIKNTFPNINAAVTATPSQLNNVAAAYDYRVPAGGIIMWSGASNAIPTGWFLCDGANGTPDLRNRFVVGAGSSYAVGATGGTKDAVVVSHTHSATGSAGSSGTGISINGVGDHTHTYNTKSGTLPQSGSATQVWVGDATATTGGAGAHTHSINDPGHSHSVSVSVASTGESGTDKNLPPYFALCFIMKA